MGTSLVLLPCVVVGAEAQYLPLIFSEEPKWAVSAVYQVMTEPPSLFDPPKPDVELQGIRLRHNLMDKLGVEATATRFVGAGRQYGKGLAHYGVSLYHTLVPTSEGRRFAVGYEIGMTEFERFEVAPSFHSQLWGILRMLGGPDRSLSMGLRGGGWYNRQTRGGQHSNVGLALGLMAIFDYFYVRTEWESSMNGAFDYREVYTIEAGIRR